jgi:uncharacterized membrane protein YkvA (DUF1232 family)
MRVEGKQEKSMSRSSNRGGSSGSPGALSDLLREVQLAWRLFFDPRTPIYIKVIPLLIIAYILFPIDLVPDPVLGLGQLDDLGLFILGVTLIRNLAPQHIVQEHTNPKAGRQRSTGKRSSEEDCIDAEYRVLHDD